MSAGIQEHEIAFFRYRNRLAAGICLKESQGKARFAVTSRESVNVPLGNVLLGTGESAAGPREAEKWWDRANSESEQIDLEELWQLVHEEENPWSVADLADFYYGDSPSKRQIAASERNTNTGRSTAAMGRSMGRSQNEDRPKSQDEAET